MIFSRLFGHKSSEKNNTAFEVEKEKSFYPAENAIINQIKNQPVNTEEKEEK